MDHLLNYVVHYIFARAIWDALRATHVPYLILGIGAVAVYYGLRTRARR